MAGAATAGAAVTARVRKDRAEGGSDTALAPALDRSFKRPDEPLKRFYRSLIPYLIRLLSTNFSTAGIASARKSSMSV